MWRQVLKHGVGIPRSFGHKSSDHPGLSQKLPAPSPHPSQGFPANNKRVQQGRAGDTPRQGWPRREEEPPSHDGQEGLSRTGGFLELRKCAPIL